MTKEKVIDAICATAIILAVAILLTGGIVRAQKTSDRALNSDPMEAEIYRQSLKR